MTANKNVLSRDYAFPIIDAKAAQEARALVRDCLSKKRLPGVVELKEQDYCPYSIVVAVKPSFLHPHPEKAVEKLIQKTYLRLAQEELKQERQKRLSLLAFIA